MRSAPIAAILIALALAGCGSSSSEGTSGTTSTSTPEASHANPPTATVTEATPEGPVGVRATPCQDNQASGGEFRVTGVSCEKGREVVAGWHKNSECFSPGEASRTSCRLGDFLCLGARTGAGISVACAGPERSVVFLAKNG